MEKIAIGSDHAGFELKEKIKKILEGMNLGWEDMGTKSTDSCDYPIMRALLPMRCLRIRSNAALSAAVLGSEFR